MPTHKVKKAKPQRHRWFDQWLVAKGDALCRLVDTTVHFLEQDEKHRGLRQRARRAQDAAHFNASVDAVVSNMAYAILVPSETGRIAVKLGSQRSGMTRYDNPALGSKPFRKLIHRLASLDVLSLKQADQRGEVSSIVPSEWFASKVGEHGISLADFGRSASEEVISLTRNRRSSGANEERVTERERIDYRETRATRLYRDELLNLNAFLAAADIAFIEDGLKPRVDPFDRTLRRHFVILSEQHQRFDQGGRLFGGFWMSLNAERRKNIRINGEPVADLDFSTMFTRLAYGRLGMEPPKGDLYAIAGAENHRSGIKMAMNTFLFDTHARRSAWPKEMGVGVGSDSEPRDPAFEARLPAGWTVGRTRKAILRCHPALEEAWGKALGYRLMFDESRVLLLALNRLMTKSIPALGMHDGLLVQRSKLEIAKAIMAKAAKEIAGVDIPVEEKE
ncbi:MAG TPA: hypothetical protein PL193_15325 [Xanthobacteraceae bacterium]|nr:hypothetical protein [Xanthobacteraceae bacterium]